MTRILMTAAAGALACVALLAGCDQSKSAAAPAATDAPSASVAPVAPATVPATAPDPAPVAPPAAPSAATASAAPAESVPAATAQIVSTSSIEQVRVPHAAKDGEEGLSSLKAMEGKYRWDGVDYLKTGVLAQRLKALTGAQYEAVLKNLDAVGPLETQGSAMAVFGNRQRMGGEESAAIVIDPARNGLRVWLLSAGRQTVFTDVQGDDIPWPESVQRLIQNVVAQPAS